MLVFDLETDGLLHELTTIHTLSIQDADTGAVTRYDKSDVPKGLRRLAVADDICGHNIIDFDIPAIQKVFSQWNTRANLWDTLVWCRLLYPDIKGPDYSANSKGILPGRLIGSHALEAWGYRLGEFKGDFGKQTDWSEWSKEMSDYCEQDVRVTTKLYNFLLERTSSEVMSEALPLEHGVQTIITRQMRYGFYFDKQKAEQLYIDLGKRKTELEDQLRESFPPFYVADKEFTPKADNKRYGYTKGATMTKVRLVDFNPSSGRHIYWMFKKKYGWSPKAWTNTPGVPTVDEDILNSLSYPEAELIAEYWTIDKRMGMIYDGKGSWLKYYDENTGRIYGYVNPCGAITTRMSHSKPNVAQVPSNANPYGERCRECWTVPPGKKLVGIDADSLEMRLVAHYIGIWDGGEYAKAVTQGSKEDGTDPHTMNMYALDIDDRNTAKTWFYAWLYGAGNATLGGYLGVGSKKAKQKNDEFLKRSPALAKLKKVIEQKVKTKGYLVGLDGRRLHVRSAHSALNLLVQSAGAIVMKKAMVMLDRWLQERGYIPGQHYEFVANIHDEWQIECDPDVAETVGKTGTKAIEDAGKYYKLNCPLSGNFDIGDSWKETH